MCAQPRAQGWAVRKRLDWEGQTGGEGCSAGKSSASWEQPSPRGSRAGQESLLSRDLPVRAHTGHKPPSSTAAGWGWGRGGTRSCRSGYNSRSPDCMERGPAAVQEFLASASWTPVNSINRWVPPVAPTRFLEEAWAPVAGRRVLGRGCRKAFPGQGLQEPQRPFLS